MAAPDPSAMTLPELLALDVALRLAIGGLEAAGGGDAAIFADAEGVSITVTIPIRPIRSTHPRKENRP